MPTIVSIELGGTGANTAAGARAALGAASAVDSNLSYGQANSAYSQANSAYNQANSAYTAANTAQTTAQNAYAAANNAVLKAGDTITGNLNVAATIISQNVLPNLNVTYNLGSSDKRFKDLYLSNSTIYLGDATITANGSKLVVPAIETSSGINLESQVSTSYSQANSAYTQSNSAYAQANAAYSQANSAYTQSNSAYSQANSAYTQSNSAYAQANSAYGQANSAYTQSNSAYSQANSGYSQANNAYSQANSAYGQANSAYGAANTAQTTAQDAYNQANTATTNAGNAYSQANAAYLQANTAFTAANNSNLKLGGVISGSLNVTNDIIVGGNVYLQGNTTFINVATYQVNDSLMYIAANNILTDSIDIGFVGGKNTSGTFSHTGFARDATDGKYKLFDSLADSGHVGNVIDFANTTVATLVANIEANSILLSGNAVATNVSVSAAYGQANAAYTQANNAYSQANLAYTQANNAYSQANSGYTQANSAYSAANNRVLKAGDTMTGQLNISSGGLLVTGNSNFDSGTLFVDSVNDRIGIGTTSPTQRLEVVGNALVGDGAAATRRTLIVNGGANAGVGAYLGVQIGGSLVGTLASSGWAAADTSTDLALYADTGKGIRFYSAASERMRLDSSGNLGIGTSSPTAKLTVKGDIDFQATNSTNKWAVYTYTDNTFRWNYNGSGADELTMDSSGNLGIGTTSPSYKLHVRLPTTTSDVVQRWESPSYDSVDLYVGSSQAYFGTVSTTPLAFRTNNTERMRFTGDGNAIIGTTVNNPSSKLFVSGAITSDYSSTISFRYNVSGQTTNYFKGMTGTSIETALARGLHIFNYDADSNEGIAFYPNNYAGQTANPAMKITSGGNVGIGTTSPVAVFDVYSAGSAAKFRGTAGTTQVNIVEFNNITNSGYLSVTAAGNASAVATWSNGSMILEGVPASTGDTILSSFSGRLLFQTSSRSNRLVIDSSGNVGIGTTNPVDRFDVRGGSFFFNRGTGSLGDRYIYINKGANNDGGILLTRDNVLDWQIVNNVTNGDLGFYSYGASSQVFYIKRADGNVGIGTTSPYEKLHVVGSSSTGILYLNDSTSGATTTGSQLLIARASTTSTQGQGIAIRFQDTAVTNNIRIIESGGGALQFIAYRSGWVTDMIINSSGNLGIGTTSPDTKLHIYHAGQPPVSDSLYASMILDTDSTTNYQRIRFDVGATPYWGIMREGTTNNFSISGRINGSWSDNVLTITPSAGNVGIGTTSPSRNLHVHGNARIGTGTNSNGNALTIAHSNYNQVNITHGNTAGWGLLLGFGDGSLSTNYHGNNHAAIINVQYAPLHLGTNNDTRVTIDGDGKVGIATTAPSQKLHVNDGAIAVETATSVSSNFNWYSQSDSQNQVIVTDNNQLYIKKIGSGGSYSDWVYWPEKVGKNFNLSFRLKGGTPSSGYRHVGIAIASDGSATTNNFDYIVFRHNTNNSADNQIRVDRAGSTEESLVSSSVPNFWDGTERRVLIKVRNNYYVIEIDGTIVHTMKATSRTRSSGVIGFAIYESTDSNTHITVSNFRIQHLLDTDTNTPAWNLRPNTGTNVTLATNDEIIGWSDNTSSSSSKGCYFHGVTLTGSASGVAGATSTGRITFPMAGKYKIWVTCRFENTPGVGNIYVAINGTVIARQHVEAWGVGPYYHGFHSHVVNVAANDYIEIRLLRNGGVFSGYNDTVNWFGGHYIKET